MNASLPLSEKAWVDLLQDVDDMEEKIEEIIASIRVEVLNRFAVPNLLKKQLDQLEQLSHAMKFLGFTEADDKPFQGSVELSWAAQPSLISFLSRYETEISSVKLKLMQSNTLANLKEAIEWIQKTEYTFGFTFLELTSDYETYDGQVLSREKTDTGLLLLCLRNERMSEARTMISKERRRLLSIYS